VNQTETPAYSKQRKILYGPVRHFGYSGLVVGGQKDCGRDSVAVQSVVIFPGADTGLLVNRDAVEVAI
jgi:hypothetical protein